MVGVEVTCSVSGCDRIARQGRGMCRAHYQRVRRHGDAMPDLPIGGRRPKEEPAEPSLDGYRSYLAWRSDG